MPRANADANVEGLENIAMPRNVTNQARNIRESITDAQR